MLIVFANSTSIAHNIASIKSAYHHKTKNYISLRRQICHHLLNIVVGKGMSVLQLLLARIKLWHGLHMCRSYTKYQTVSTDVIRKQNSQLVDCRAAWAASAHVQVSHVYGLSQRKNLLHTESRNLQWWLVLLVWRLGAYKKVMQGWKAVSGWDRIKGNHDRLRIIDVREWRWG